MNSTSTPQQQYEEEEIPWCYANSTIDTIADDKCFCSVGGCAVPTFEEEDDDECIIQYRKEIEEGCPEGHKTVWDNHGFRYEEEENVCSLGHKDGEFGCSQCAEE